jgi:uncharacterized protein with PIN domain
MNVASFTFFAELNDFLPRKRQNTTFSYSFEDHQTIKHVIECLGVPHNEVNHLRADGRPVDFSYHIHDGEHVTAFPISAPPVPGDILLQVDPDSISTFVLDNHLGRLAAYLRMLGFDTLYRNDYQDEELATDANHQSRTLLTRDQHLLMRNAIRNGYWIRHQDPQRQLVEVVKRYRLSDRIQPFLRCLRCNHLLEPVSKEQVLPRLQPLTRLYFDEFHICPACNQIYWKGSHYEHMLEMLSKLSLPWQGQAFTK